MVVPGEDVSYELGTPEQQEIEQKTRNQVFKKKRDSGLRVIGAGFRAFLNL